MVAKKKTPVKKKTTKKVAAKPPVKKRTPAKKQAVAKVEAAPPKTAPSPEPEPFRATDIPEDAFKGPQGLCLTVQANEGMICDLLEAFQYDLDNVNEERKLVEFATYVMEVGLEHLLTSQKDAPEVLETSDEEYDPEFEEDFGEHIRNNAVAA